MSYRTTRPRLMEAGRTGVCAEKGTPIKRGDRILYDPAKRAAYCADSAAYKAEEERQRADAWNRAHNMADANW